MTYSTLVNLDIVNYPSYGPVGTTIKAISNNINQFNFDNLDTYSLVDHIEGIQVSLVLVSKTSTEAVFTIPASATTALFNSLCIVVLKTLTSLFEVAGGFLVSTDSSQQPLTTLPSSGLVSSASVTTEGFTKGTDIVFNSSNFQTSPGPAMMISSSVGASITSFTTGAKTFRFVVPSTLSPGVYQILIQYLYDDGMGTTAILPLNIGTFTVFSNTPVCFGRGARILCEHSEIPIENLSVGDRVRTLCSGFLPVKVIGRSKIQNSGDDVRSKDRLYTLRPSRYEGSGLYSDLVLTGCHSVLVDSISESQKKTTLQYLNDVYVTDGKYRLITCADERALPLAQAGEFDIYHFALECDTPNVNHGVYANGLLVETCFEKRIRECM